MSFRNLLPGIIAVIALAAILVAVKPFNADTGESLELIVSSSAGGSPDLIARTLAEHYRNNRGIDINVVNVEGVSGELGLQRFLQSSSPEDTMFLAQESLLTINPSLFERDYAATMDKLAPVGAVATSHFYLLVRADDPIDSFGDFLALADNPDERIKYGSGGVGTLHHLAMESLKQNFDLPLVHVPYTSNGQAAQGLLSGDIRAQMAGNSAMGLVESGDLKMIAVTAPERMEDFQGVPAIAEYLPDFEARNWFGLFARAGISDPRLARAREDLHQILGDPVFRQKLRTRGRFSTLDMTIPEFRTLIREERQRFSRMLSRLDIQ